MTENTYRFLLGSALFAILYLESDTLAYILIAMTLFEGLTNLRVNILISKLLNKLFAKPIPQEPQSSSFRVNIAAERAQRIFIAVVFYLIYFIAPHDLWMLNWLFALGMILSGIVMFCPVVALFRYLGFR